MKTPRIEFYRDANGQHRWRAVAANGKKVADCAEGYTTQRAAKNGAQATFGAFVSRVVSFDGDKRL